MMYLLNLWTISCLICVAFSEKHEIQLEDNGYKGVRIVISDNVPENTRLIDTLKTAFTEASRLLYTATKNFVYFKEITIVVPKSWSSSSQYTRISGSVSDSADFLVDKEKSETGNAPYVHGLTDCGGQGLYAHLTPDLVLSSLTLDYGPLDKILVHEWAHLRWGLFDEYPTAEYPSVEYIERFYNEDGTWKPIMCTDKIEGLNLRDCSNPWSGCFTDDVDNKPERTCQFCIQIPNRAQASLMAYQWISSVVEFCDEDIPSVSEPLRHNKRAPNDQNKYCGQSAWEVMRRSNDFKAPNTHGPDSKDTTPVFTILQEGELRIALVLDISNSMNARIVGPTRLQLLQDIVSHFLMYTIPLNTAVGIVTFSSTAQIITTMTTVTSSAIREILVQSLPTVASGYTAIGDGLLKGIEVLNTTGSVRGSTIILVSDGRENRRPLVADVLPTLVDSGITIHTLAISKQSDSQLTSISESTGGRSFFYSESVGSTVLQDAFLEMLPLSDSPVQMVSQSLNVLGGSPMTGEFYIDSTVGVKTVLQVLVNDTSTTDVRVSGPDGSVYTATSGMFANSVDRHVAISGTAAPGKYTYSITSDTNLQGTLSVQSGKRDPSADGLLVHTWTSERQYSYGPSSTFRVFTSVLRNKSPVFGATVIANLENEDGTAVTINLKDNGVGSDIRSDDGIYSGSVLPRHITLDGRLSVKVTAGNTEGTAKFLSAASGIGASPVNGTGNPVSLVTLENFQRVSQAGEVVVQDYVPGAFQDLIAPAKITTLSLVSINDATGVIVVTWKAVGDDIDDGTATEYDIRLSTNFDNLKTNPGSASKLTSQIPTPKAPGETETYTFTLPNQNRDGRTYYLIVRAIDDRQNVGQVSNTVSVSLLTDSNWISTTTTSTTTTTTTTTTPETTTALVQRPDYGASSSVLIGLCTAAGVAAIGLIMLGINFSCMLGRWRNDRYQNRSRWIDVEANMKSSTPRSSSRTERSKRKRKPSSRQSSDERYFKRSRHKGSDIDIYYVPELSPYEFPYYEHSSFYSSSVPRSAYR